MMTTPYRRVLSSGLILKSLNDETDAVRLIAFNGQIFGQDVADMTRGLMFHHPALRPDYWLYIEDESTQQILSSLVLIPQTWRYGDVTLKCGEMGIVGTLESQRGKGLVRELVVRFKELLREGGFDLSIIQGIPYFYRQFGYEYALPLEAQWTIELRNIPEVVEKPYRFRTATVEDIPLLKRLYDEAALDISVVRDADVWRYLLDGGLGTATEAETWLMLDADNQPVGYFRIPREGFGAGLIVSETSRLNTAAGEALLGWLKTTAVERGKPYVRFNLPANNDLNLLARTYGAYDAGGYAWQIHVVDAARLLWTIAPVFNQRIAASMYAGLTQTVLLNLYKEAFELRFEGGKLLAVEAVGFRDSGEIRIPPNLLPLLVLGHRSHEELRQTYPDVAVWGQSRHLVDMLFPKMDAFIYTNY